MLVCMTLHNIAHKGWFSNYWRIMPDRRVVASLILLAAALLVITGIPMIFRFILGVSVAHCFLGIVITILSAGHFAKRCGRL